MNRKHLKMNIFGGVLVGVHDGVDGRILWENHSCVDFVVIFFLNWCNFRNHFDSRCRDGGVRVSVFLGNDPGIVDFHLFDLGLAQVWRLVL